MTKIRLQELIEKTDEPWEPREIAAIHDTALRIAKIDGAYKWHTHQHEDELFLVLRGKIFIDTREGTVELNENEGYVVEKGMRHRSRSDAPAWILLVEPKKTKTKGETP